MTGSEAGHDMGVCGGGEIQSGGRGKNAGAAASLLAALAHEAIHLHQWFRKLDRGGEHNADFKIRARQVCRIHGFDPKTF